MLAPFMVRFHPTMIMSMYIQTPRQPIHRLVRQQDLIWDKQWTRIDFIEQILICSSCIMISQKQNLFSGLNHRHILRITHIAQAHKCVTLKNRFIYDPQLFLRSYPIRIHQFAIAVIKMQIWQYIYASFLRPMPEWLIQCWYHLLTTSYLYIQLLR